MSIIVLKLPEVKVIADRPRTCPSCKGEILQRWGGQVRRIRDHRVKEVVVYRYRCTSCRHTFRHYPEGGIRDSRASDCANWRRCAGCWD